MASDGGWEWIPKMLIILKAISVYSYICMHALRWLVGLNFNFLSFTPLRGVSNPVSCFFSLVLWLRNASFNFYRLKTSARANHISVHACMFHSFRARRGVGNFQVGLVIAILPAHRWNMSCGLFSYIHRINTRIRCRTPFPWV
jgi:hypothetical protein